MDNTENESITIKTDPRRIDGAVRGALMGFDLAFGDDMDAAAVAAALVMSQSVKKAGWSEEKALAFYRDMRVRADWTEEERLTYRDNYYNELVEKLAKGELSGADERSARNKIALIDQERKNEKVREAQSEGRISEGSEAVN